MSIKPPNNLYLHILLLALLPATISKSIRDHSHQNIVIPNSINELHSKESYIIGDQKLNISEQDQLLEDIKQIRKRTENSEIYIVHYEPTSDLQQKINDCQIDHCSELIDELFRNPVTVEIPKDLSAAFLILHSDVPVNWKFGVDHRYVEGLFFTGLYPSNIVHSNFTTRATPLFSYKNLQKCPATDTTCRFTNIQNLQNYIDENQYKMMIKLIFKKEASKFITLS